MSLIVIGRYSSIPIICGNISHRYVYICHIQERYLNLYINDKIKLCNKCLKERSINPRCSVYKLHFKVEKAVERAL